MSGNIEGLSQQLERARGELSRQKADLLHKEMEMESVHEKKKRLTDLLNSQKAQLAKIESQHKILEPQVRAAEVKLGTLKSSRKDLLEKATRLERSPEKSRLERQIETLESDIQAHEKKIAADRAIIKVDSDKLGKMESDRSEIAGKSSALDGSKEEIVIQRAFASKSQELKKGTEEMEALTSALRTSELELANLVHADAAAANTLKMLRANVENKEREVQRMKNAYEDAVRNSSLKTRV